MADSTSNQHTLVTW